MRRLLGPVMGLVSVLICAPAFGHPDGHPDHDHDVRVVEPWIRETAPKARTAAAYMVLWNRGESADRLVSASTAVAERVEIHTIVADGDRRSMRPLPDGLALPGQEAQTLEPGGLHLMLLGLKAGLEAGESVDMVMRFEKAGEIHVKVPVRELGAGMDLSDKRQHMKDNGHSHR